MPMLGKDYAARFNGGEDKKEAAPGDMMKDAQGAAEKAAFRDLKKALMGGDEAAGVRALKAFAEACGWGGSYEETETE